MASCVISRDVASRVLDVNDIHFKETEGHESAEGEQGYDHMRKLLSKQSH